LLIKFGLYNHEKIKNYCNNILTGTKSKIVEKLKSDTSFTSKLKEVSKNKNALVNDIKDLCSDKETMFLRSWIITRKYHPFGYQSRTIHQSKQTDTTPHTSLYQHINLLNV
jgi:hypothetical protein